MDLVNDVLSKEKYFIPQGWEPLREALREANVPQCLIGHARSIKSPATGGQFQRLQHVSWEIVV
jgi:hypothetical protein